MDSGLNLLVGATVANPHDAVSRLLARIENSNHIARPELGIESRQQRPADADVTGASFLQEPVAFGIDAPHHEHQIGFNAWFPARSVVEESVPRPTLMTPSVL